MGKFRQCLILTAVRFATEQMTNLLPEPVIIAQVLNLPSDQASSLVIYQSATNQIRINGAGFIGAHKVDFYFNPSIFKEVAYEDVTPYPLTCSQIVLR